MQQLEVNGSTHSSEERKRGACSIQIGKATPGLHTPKARDSRREKGGKAKARSISSLCMIEMRCQE